MWTLVAKDNPDDIPSLDLFGVVQAHRTFSNHFISETERCIESSYKSSGWFDCAEPYTCTLVKVSFGGEGEGLCRLSQNL